MLLTTAPVIEAAQGYAASWGSDTEDGSCRRLACMQQETTGWLWGGSQGPTRCQVGQAQ